MIFGRRVALCIIAGWVCAGSLLAAEDGIFDATRLSVESEFIITIDYLRTVPGTDAAGAGIGESQARLRPNMEDSDFFLSADQRLFGSDSIGGVALRIRMEDNTAQPRLFGYLASSAYRLAFGRLRLNNKFIRFPTPRNEDLITYTHILSGALGEKQNSQHLYGDNIILDLYARSLNLSLTAFYHGRAYSELAADTGKYEILEEEDVTPGGGVGLSYLVPEDDAAAHILQSIGLLYDRQDLERQNGDAAVMNQYLAGGLLQLGTGDGRWRLGGQFIRNDGLADRDATGKRVFPELADDLPREAGLSSMVSLQYLAGGEAWRSALIYAQKDYDDIAEGRQFTLVPNLLVRVAPNLDLLAQWLYTQYAPGLVPIVKREREWVLQLGLVMELEAATSEQLGFDDLLQVDSGELLRGY